MKVYGITNCNTVKKALNWLKQHNISYEFHDFKKLGVSAPKLDEWNARAGYEQFLNKQGLTWRGLDEQTRQNVTSAAQALPLLQQKPTMIKRPVIEHGDFLYFGFDEEVYQHHLGK